MDTRPTVALTTKAGDPLLCRLAIRESQTMPGRLKVTLVASTDEGIGARDLSEGVAVASVSDLPEGEVVALCPEWRLEMN